MIETTPSLEFSEAINTAGRKIFQIKGRSRRSEFLWTQLLVHLLYVALTPLVGIVLSMLTIPLTIRRLHDTGRSGWWWGIGAILNFSFFIAMFYDIINMAFNQIDITAAGNEELAVMLILKYVGLGFAITVYQIVLFVLCCLDSEKSENKYGPSPKYIEKEDI